jgi:ATP-binding cassette subfamily B protein
VLSSVVSNAVSLVLIVAAMFTLSWQLTLGASSWCRSSSFPLASWASAGRAVTLQMNLNADMGSRMTERFNVAGACWSSSSATRRGGPRVRRAARPGPRRRRQHRHEPHRVHGGARLVAALATAMVYGFGGVMAVNGALTVGTLLAWPPCSLACMRRSPRSPTSGSTS